MSPVNCPIWVPLELNSLICPASSSVTYRFPLASNVVPALYDVPELSVMEPSRLPDDGS